MNASVKTSYALRDKFSGLYIEQNNGTTSNTCFAKNIENAWLAPLEKVKAKKAEKEFPELYEIIEVDVITSVEYAWRPAITQE